MPRQLDTDQATSKQCPQNTSSQGAAGLKSCPTSQSAFWVKSHPRYILILLHCTVRLKVRWNIKLFQRGMKGGLLE